MRTGAFPAVMLAAAYAAGFTAVFWRAPLLEATGPSVLLAPAPVYTAAGPSPAAGPFASPALVAPQEPVAKPLAPAAPVYAPLFADAPASGAEVRVYVAPDPAPLHDLFARFEALSGIKVLAAGEPTDRLIARIQAERPAPRADVLLLPDLLSLAKAERSGAFAPAAAPSEAVPRGYKGAGGSWVAVSRRWHVPFYAKDQDTPPPVDYADLAASRFKGKFILPVSEGHVAMLAGMEAEGGEARATEWMQAVSANLTAPPSGDETEQLRKLAAGKAAVTLADTSSYARLFHTGYAKDQVAAETVAPAPLKGGAYADMHGAGVIAGAVRSDSAAKLLEFMLSPEGARLLADAYFEYPVSDEIPPLPSVAAAGKSKPRGGGPAEALQAAAAAAELARRAAWIPGK